MDFAAITRLPIIWQVTFFSDQITENGSWKQMLLFLFYLKQRKMKAHEQLKVGPE